METEKLIEFLNDNIDRLNDEIKKTPKDEFGGPAPDLYLRTVQIMAYQSVLKFVEENA
jgi:hypothetical protein